MSQTRPQMVRAPLATPAEVAAYLGKPESMLRQWRYLKKGPRYLKVGHEVRYDWRDIDAWLDTQARGPEAA